METVKLGELVPPEMRGLRDAVHVAVIPQIALREMQPGEQTTNGCVDPFLTKPVRFGEWYWLCIKPGTVTSLRHAWEHPAYPVEAALPNKKRSEADVWAEIGGEG